MKEFKGTKGPWEVGKKETLVKSTKYPVAVAVGAVSKKMKRKEQIANAKLIAAAPELLIACQNALRINDLWANTGNESNAEHQGKYEALSKMEGMLVNAIKKALD